MELLHATLFPDAVFGVKSGIHIQEGDEKTMPHFELGLPEGEGPYAKVRVDPALFALVPRRFEECPLNGELTDNMVKGQPTCPECGVTVDELSIRRKAAGEKCMGIDLNTVTVLHDTIDVANRLMEAEPRLVFGDGDKGRTPTRPMLVEDLRGDRTRVGVLFSVEADEGMTCWIESKKLDPKLFPLHSKMIGTRTDDYGVATSNSQDRFVIMRPGHEVRIVRRQYDNQRDEVLRTEYFVVGCDRELKLRIVSRMKQGGRKESSAPQTAKAK